jgi:hypothetical protein
MSPSAFHDQHTSILTTLNSTYDLCQIIRTSRRVGSTTPHLDAFQSSLLTVRQNLSYQFSTLRSILGSRFDLGDTTSRTALSASINTLQAIQSKLSSVAYGHERSAGFQSLHYQLQNLETDILSIFSGLKYRLEFTPKEQEKPKPILKKTKTEEVVIGIKKLDAYMDHMKNSWLETCVDGEIFYVNAFDEKKRQWERPKDGFVKLLPKVEKPKRRSTWEKELEREREWQNERERERKEKRDREERRRRADPWGHLDGW